jgi:hypothetical protein
MENNPFVFTLLLDQSVKCGHTSKQADNLCLLDSSPREREYFICAVMVVLACTVIFKYFALTIALIEAVFGSIFLCKKLVYVTETVRMIFYLFFPFGN